MSQPSSDGRLPTANLVALLEEYRHLREQKRAPDRKARLAALRAAIEPALPHTAARENLQYYRRNLDAGEVDEVIGAVQSEEHVALARAWKRRALWSLVVLTPLSIMAVLAASSAISQATPAGMARARTSLWAARLLTILAFVLGPPMWIALVLSGMAR